LVYLSASLATLARRKLAAAKVNQGGTLPQFPWNNVDNVVYRAGFAQVGAPHRQAGGDPRSLFMLNDTRLTFHLSV